MNIVISAVFVLLVTLSRVTCYCPLDKVHKTGHCSFSYSCINTIHGIGLSEECQGSTNHPVSVDVTLTDAIERFDDRYVDAEFLVSVTSLKITANWPETSLSLLEYMPRLQILKLSHCHIRSITGSPFYTLNRLQEVDLSHNKLSNFDDLFIFEHQPNKMEKLSLANNAIDEIPGEAFEELTSLVELDLSHNYIANLNEEPFYNLTKLEILRLNNNKIKNLNGAVNNLKNLKHLYLRDNEIQNIDEESLTVIYHLETFDVSNNQLDNLIPILFYRHWLHFGSPSVNIKMLLSGNHITSIPNTTSEEIWSRFTRDLSKRRFRSKDRADVFTELDLSKNSISKIEYNAFQPIVRMISLDLSCNKLTYFAINSKDLEHIKFLNLSTNYIRRLYFDSFSSMNNLQNLDLSHNNLDYIPDQTFENNNNLKYVNMTFNEIKHLEHLHIRIFHREGGILDLSNNGLSKLNIPYGDGLRLSHLILHSNNITNLTEIDLSHQNDLRELDMSGNYIEVLEKNSLRLPNNLVSLSINYNFVRKVGPSSFHKTQHLKTLRLAHNRLRTVEYGAFQGLVALENLDLSNNSIVYLDSFVFMDLKSLRVLSLKFNGMQDMNYKGWLGHKYDLKVYLDGNNLSCAWLGKALTDYNNGYSKMHPAALVEDFTGHSLEGVPCLQGKSVRIRDLSEQHSYVLADERLLITSQKILDAIKDQTFFLKKYLHLLQNETKL